jgi:hypothetical protein
MSPLGILWEQPPAESDTRREKIFEAMDGDNRD